MKRPLIFSSTLTFLLFFLLSVCFAATTLYVTSENAELKSDCSSSSATIVELKRGSALTLVVSEGRWYKVTTLLNETGWIYRGKVSEEEPEIEDAGDDEGGLGGLLGGLSGSDINADAADSSRSIRGLSPEAKEYAETTGTPQQSQDALDSVISLKTSNQEIDQFLKEGKIGEYAD
ncbi:MAG: SH3 domain-containing protein [Desulfobacteraceae bacterium]|nr:SH3 domain-containing protein [Desulfobacteraceae bacterium]MBC2756470.1 SH3 domain-containing protein [Desulfobacteraceae bacterium]